LAKSFLPQNLALRTGGWPRKPSLPLRGCTLGLVGLGRIGRAVALRGRAFGMNVLAFEPYPDLSFCATHGLRLGTFEEVLRQSDYVSLHAPADARSHHLINARTLALMKPTAFLINTARGALVDEAALLTALQTKQIAGAGLDVFEQEPPGLLPFAGFDNVALTAHTAGVDQLSLQEMATSAATALLDLVRGVWPAEKVVNPAVRPRWETRAT
jgi:phosphoglycerate dehydrogenase-like enzyme